MQAYSWIFFFFCNLCALIFYLLQLLIKNGNSRWAWSIIPVFCQACFGDHRPQYVSDIRVGHMSECCIDLLRWSVRRAVWLVVLGATLKCDLIVTGLNWKTNISTQNSLGSVSKISQEENVFCLRMSECVGDAIVLILVFQQRCNEESGGKTFYAFL